jgi:hypothetical protein
MTEPTDRSSPGVKTLGVKLGDKIHAQFAMVAQLNGLTLADAVTQAVIEYIERNRAEATFAERAAAVIAEIDREAEQRRGAIQALFGDQAPAASEQPATGRKARNSQTS